MAKDSINNGPWCTSYQILLFCLTLLFLLWGCGGDASEQGAADRPATASADTGSASLAIQWHATAGVERASAAARQAIASCEAAGVASITCEVYDASHNHLAGGGPWDCSDRQGTIDQIPAGENRMFFVLGWNGTEGTGEAVYQGQTQANITISPGQTTDAGTIDAYPFVPEAPVIDNVYGNRIDLSWKDPGFGTYRIYRDGVAVADSTQTVYSDTGLTQQTQYCYTVSAIDGFGNESGQSDPTCATTTLLYIWYRDGDEDTYGDPDNSIQVISASPPEGYVADNTDCNDGKSDINPGEDEYCFDGLDNNCVDGIDEHCVTANEDCIAFEPKRVIISNRLIDLIWVLAERNGDMQPLVFVAEEEARQAQDTILYYEMNGQCFVGPHDDPSMMYWLVNGNAPSGVFASDAYTESCLYFDPDAIYLVQEVGQWLLTDGLMRMLVYPTYEEAQQGLQTIRYYGFRYQCAVGSMSYWRR